MSEPVPDRALLRQLLRQYNERPELHDHVRGEIDRQFLRTVAILVLDCSGFTRTTRLKGIVHFLALIERLERLVSPTIGHRGGSVLRTEADNLFAVFPDIAAATACAEAIQRDVSAANEVLPEAEELYVAIGLGYGPVLMVDPDDVYGDEMNLACKLGEDLARRGEILLTPAAREALGTCDWRFEELEFSLSGLDLLAYRMVR